MYAIIATASTHISQPAAVLKPTSFDPWNPITASHNWWAVFFTGDGDSIAWMWRLYHNWWYSSEAETICIVGLVSDGKVGIIWRQLDVLLLRTEVLEGCDSKKCHSSLHVIAFMVMGGSSLNLVIWVDQDTKWKLRTRSFIWCALSILFLCSRYYRLVLK